MEEIQQCAGAASTRTASPWSPLVWPAFRALWLATLISNTGGWMQDVGASWLMTSLTRSATLIALVQAAESLPMFFLAIPAGALADIVERRLLMLTGNLVSLCAVVAKRLHARRLDLPGIAARTDICGWLRRSAGGPGI